MTDTAIETPQPTSNGAPEDTYLTVREIIQQMETESSSSKNHDGRVSALEAGNAAPPPDEEAPAEEESIAQEEEAPPETSSQTTTADKETTALDSEKWADYVRQQRLLKLETQRRQTLEGERDQLQMKAEQWDKFREQLEIDPAAAVEYAGKKWDDFIVKAKRAPAANATDAQMAKFAEQLNKLQEQNQQLHNSLRESEAVAEVKVWVAENAEKYPRLAKHPMAAKAIYTDYMDKAQSGQSASPEAVADVLESRLKLEEVKAKLSALESKGISFDEILKRLEGMEGIKPKTFAATKTVTKAGTQNGQTPVTLTNMEAEAAATDDDDVSVLTRKLGRPPSDRELLRYIVDTQK